LQEEFGQTCKQQTKKSPHLHTAWNYFEVSKLLPTVPAISVEFCRVLDHVCGLRFVDEELIPVVPFVEDMQGCGRLQKKVPVGRYIWKFK
jgi:hypothetical protein